MRNLLLAALASLLVLPVHAALASTIRVTGTNQQGKNVFWDYNSATGALLSTTLVPASLAQSDDVRDIAVDSTGRTHIFQGETKPYLATYTGSSWLYHTASPWSTYNIGYYGALTSYGQFVFAQSQSEDSSINGVLRFDAEHDYATQFVQFKNPDNPDETYQPTDLNVGLNGYLYVNTFVQSFSPNRVYKVDPTTLSILNYVDLVDKDGNALVGDHVVADKQGNLYTTGIDSNMLSKFGPDGVLLEAIDLPGPGDLDISPDGEILVMVDHTAYLFSFDLTELRHFDLAPGATFTTFVPAVTPEPTALAAGGVALVGVLARRRRRTA